MLFNFQLRELSEVTPWVYGGQLYLEWFGLTEGWYWLQVNESDEIFRYSPELLAYWQEEYLEGEPITFPYADYYVVRFWQDLLDILPHILDPLPPRLAHMLETEEQVNQWLERVEQATPGHCLESYQTRRRAAGTLSVARFIVRTGLHK